MGTVNFVELTLHFPLYIFLPLEFWLGRDVVMGASMFRILLAGSDSRLLATRAAVLSKTDASVVHRNAVETLNLLDRDRFDLVVLCHSLPEEDVKVIVDKVHKKIPGAKILMVTSELYGNGMHADSRIDATSLPEPGHLVALVKELLQVPSYASPAGGRDGISQTHLQ